MAVLHDYRLKIVDHMNNTTYFVRRGKITQYYSDHEVPLALSNLLNGRTAETRFKLEDAIDGGDAVKALRDVLKDIWKNNPQQAPKVTLFGGHHVLD